MKTLWPSGLRRWLKAPFRKGVGSNPTGVTFAKTDLLGKFSKCTMYARIVYIAELSHWITIVFQCVWALRLHNALPFWESTTESQIEIKNINCGRHGMKSNLLVDFKISCPQKVRRLWEWVTSLTFADIKTPYPPRNPPFRYSWLLGVMRFR